MELHVHVMAEFEPGVIDQLRDRLHNGINLTYGKDLPDPARFDVLVAGVVKDEDLTASPNLKALVIPWAGLPKATREVARRHRDIKLYNIHHNAAPTAEIAVTLMLAAAKDLVPIDRALRRGDWQPRYEESRAILIEGKTALILGRGTIGLRIEGAVKALGMKTVGVKLNPIESDTETARVYGPGEIDRLLPSADVIFVCLPLTPQTEGLLNADRLARLPQGAIVVNVARGPIIDEAALYRACAEGRLRAGLDVWYRYPRDEAARRDTTPSQYPFAELDGVVMTPHLAGHCRETAALRVQHLTRLLNDVAAGRPLPKIVDPERGY